MHIQEYEVEKNCGNLAHEEYKQLHNFHIKINMKHVKLERLLVTAEGGIYSTVTEGAEIAVPVTLRDNIIPTNTEGVIASIANASRTVFAVAAHEKIFIL
jgi:hypothetical protein